MQKLEKAKEKWQKTAQLREKAREAEKRVLAEAERAKAKIKAAAEEEILKCVLAALVTWPPKLLNWDCRCSFHCWKMPSH